MGYFILSISVMDLYSQGNVNINTLLTGVFDQDWPENYVDHFYSYLDPMLGQCECIIILFSFDEAFLRYSNLSEDYSCKAWFRRYSTHVLNLTEIK